MPEDGRGTVSAVVLDAGKTISVNKLFGIFEYESLLDGVLGRDGGGGNSKGSNVAEHYW